MQDDVACVHTCKKWIAQEMHNSCESMTQGGIVKVSSSMEGVHWQAVCQGHAWTCANAIVLLKNHKALEQTCVNAIVLPSITQHSNKPV